ncbi:hypothetical protein BCR44DRAFT_199463 [Catenaria anguillulae PL171]|uniref:Cyclin N-terminal domain-containing protein n=1 Tax=Catenaria anguillulae PL171 TaxID=765915 RepID=A0A1Y2HGS9_9FUNG|nr:hypothetical protein BCR44DRAFT_199463 [Catenaria anguillulae PL171]
MATAILYYHRLDLFKRDKDKLKRWPDLARIDSYLFATTCVYLATKATDCPRKVRDIINSANRIMTNRQFLPVDANYWKYRDSLFGAEMTILRILRFDFAVPLAYTLIVDYVLLLFGICNQDGSHPPPRPSPSPLQPPHMSESNLPSPNLVMLSPPSSSSPASPQIMSSTIPHLPPPSSASTDPSTSTYATTPAPPSTLMSSSRIKFKGPMMAMTAAVTASSSSPYPARSHPPLSRSSTSETLSSYNPDSDPDDDSDCEEPLDPIQAYRPPTLPAATPPAARSIVGVAWSIANDAHLRASVNQFVVEDVAVACVYLAIGIVDRQASDERMCHQPHASASDYERPSVETVCTTLGRTCDDAVYKTIEWLLQGELRSRFVDMTASSGPSTTPTTNTLDANHMHTSATVPTPLSIASSSGFLSAPGSTGSYSASSVSPVYEDYHLLGNNSGDKAGASGDAPTSVPDDGVIDPMRAFEAYAQQAGSAAQAARYGGGGRSLR